MSTPATPFQAASSIFGGDPPQQLAAAEPSAPNPAAASPINGANTYIMPATNSLQQNRDGYRPRIVRSLGQRPSVLVNASVTYCGDNQLITVGGYDQYSDEVYNHVLKLDLVTHQWNLVDNFGDIPGVRMGHTATLYNGKLLVFAGENEHRAFLSDLIIFDLKTAHWTQPQVSGPVPKGRARHAAVLHEDKLFIIGGITGAENYVLDDICYLDLKTFTWSRAWRFVGRFDHSAYIWNERLWVYGGLSEDMDKVSDLWWLDLKGSPAFETPPHVGVLDRSGLSRTVASPRLPYATASSTAVGASGYAANSRTAQVNPPSFQLKAYTPLAPGAISALKFVSGQNVPSQMQGTHFHLYSNGTLLDFVTPAATITVKECSLSALDLSSLRWQKLAEGREIFKPGYRWHYCTMNEDGTKAWLLGCPTDPAAIELTANGLEEYLSDIMEIDLRRYGFLGSSSAVDLRSDSLVRQSSSRHRHVEQASRGLGSDLAKLFDTPPESGSGTDFVVTALSPDDYENEERIMGSALVHLDSSAPGGDRTWLPPETPTSPPIYVHRLILQARWPHFERLWASQMAEFHTKKMHIPEPYSVVKAFLYYLYTDRIDPSGTGAGEEADVPADLSDVAGLLVMSNIYNIPRLRLLCVNRLGKELDVDHACVIWHCAGLANEEWLRKRAATFCMTHWGRVVRTSGFLRLPRTALVELSQEIDMEGRVVGGDEFDSMQLVSIDDGCRFSLSGEGSAGGRRKDSVSSSQTQMLESDADEDENMDVA